MSDKNPLQQLGDAFIEFSRRDRTDRIALFEARPRLRAALDAAYGDPSHVGLLIRHQPPVLIIQQAALAMFLKGENCLNEDAAVIRKYLIAFDEGTGWPVEETRTLESDLKEDR